MKKYRKINKQLFRKILSGILLVCLFFEFGTQTYAQEATPVVSQAPHDISTPPPSDLPYSGEPEPTLLGLSNGSPDLNPSAEIRMSTFVKSLEKKNYRAGESVKISVFSPSKNELYKVKITGPAGKKVTVEVREEELSEERLLEIVPPHEFVPGKYSVEVVDEEERVLSKQEFMWGVLAINTNKAVYLPQETAQISIAVLDETGDMVCNATVDLEITHPDSTTHTLSTGKGSINVNNQCNKKEFSLTPDYETSYKVAEEGMYKMKLTAQTKNGTYSIFDQIAVQSSIDFDIERSSTTRIYPPLTYPMTISMKANKDFTGTITDVVPDSFEVSELQESDGLPFESVRTITQAQVTTPQVLGTMDSLVLPVEKDTKVSSVFGDILKDPLLRSKYKNFGLDGHDGVDFAVPIGTTISAIDDGKVVLAEKHGDYGTTLVLQHKWGKSYYGHLSEFKAEVGQNVSKGDLVALSGNTGLSTGPHLHFGIKPNEALNNGYYGKIDPAPYLGLPDESSVLGASAVADIKVKVITWKVSVKKGDSVTLGYSYKTPPQSPQFYTLGPLKLFNESQTQLYTEGRSWQLAVDAYEGKQLKTIEYVLGGGTDASSRATGTHVYAGSSFNTTKGSAGSESVVISGSNIEVRSAYLESRFVVQTAANVTDVDMTIDTSPGPNGGSDTRVSPVIPNGNLYWNQSGLSGWMVVRGDVTGLFATQTDSEFASGITVVAGTGATVTASSFAALTTKLVITYEADYSDTAHTEIKTVRFPLDSDVAGDTGSTRAACAGSATCTFSYNAQIPDLLNSDNANIMSVFFELHGVSDSATAPSFTPQIQGGTAGVSISDQEIIADLRDSYVHFAPIVGGSDFTPNSAQKLDVVNGTVPLNTLGGELIITYLYSTGANTQTETVRFWAEQDTAENNNVKTAFPGGPSNITISNTGLSVKNLWYKVRTSHTAAITFTVFGKVGAAAELSNAYTLTGTNPRAGETVIIYDMSADASSFSSSTTKVSGSTQFSASTGDSEVSAELFVTFTWTGSSGGTQTKSVLYHAGTSVTSSAVATEYHNFPVNIFLPETVTKTHRSTYIDATHAHSDATAIQNTANTVYLNGRSLMAVTPQEDLEAFSRTYAASISAEMFNSDSSPTANTISFLRRGFTVSNTIAIAEELAASNVFAVTYDANFSQDGSAEGSKKLKTVEYVLGGGNDTTSRATATTVYAGSSWNTTKGTAGTISVELPGTGISVRNAYVESRISVSTAVNVTDVDMFFDASPGPNAGSDGRISPIIQGTHTETSGQGFWFVARGDVTGQFSTQSDSQWTSGISVVGGLQVTGPTTQLNSMKLVITYEQDYSEAAHTELKTVRFPLDSDTTGDTGTSRAVCAASATCTFSYNAQIPDLLSSNNANIESVFFELHALSDSATAPSFTPQIQGGSAGSSHSDGEALADVRDMFVLYQPSVGGSNFLPNTAQKLDIVNGALDLYALGGELIVTYKYSTDATTQTETISYFAEQDNAENGLTKTAFTRSSFTISNTGFSVKNLWYKVSTAPSAAQTFTVFGNVNSAGEQSNAYTIPGVNARTGEVIVYYDMSANASSFSSNTTTITGASQFSSATGDTEVGAELYITFTWNGSYQGAQTKTVLFHAGTSGAAATTATEYNNFPVFIFLPENVTKTHRSTYIVNTMPISDATSINNGTITLALNGVTGLSMTSQDDTEAFTATRLQEITASAFSGGSTISFKRRAFQLTDTFSGADRYSFSNIFVVTYDVDFDGGPGLGTPTNDQLMRHGSWFNANGASQPFTF